MKKISLYLLGAMTAFVCLSNLTDIFRITINKTYYTGTWDEPFAIDGGINALYNKGVPKFFMYGGTSTYPFTIAFLISRAVNHIEPVYKDMNRNAVGTDMAGYRKITPARPIYLTKAVMTCLYTFGAFILTLLCSLYLSPFPFLFWRTLEQSSILKSYRTQVLPEAHLVLFSGFTILFFINAVFATDEKKYFRYTLLTTIFASLCFATKISAAYILFLPLTLCWRIWREKTSDLKPLLKLGCAIVAPYIIVNPTVILNFRTYLNYIFYMKALAHHSDHLWTTRLGEITHYLNEVYFLSSWPNWMLILLFSLTMILFAKKNYLAFLGFMIFYLYSFQNLVGMDFQLYPRHFIFLLFPSIVFFLFPLFYLYKQTGPRVKTLLWTSGLIVSLFTLPFQESWERWKQFKNPVFSSEEKDSRDEFREFALKEKIKVYFYDYHEFTLPEDVNLQSVEDYHDLAKPLGPKEFIGLIRYKNLNDALYTGAVALVEKNYKLVKRFGPSHAEEYTDFEKFVPKSNPTIELYAAKAFEP